MPLLKILWSVNGDTCSITVIIIGNEHGDQSSNL